EDGIRDDLVTGVQTCALPIWDRGNQGRAIRQLVLDSRPGLRVSSPRAVWYNRGWFPIGNHTDTEGRCSFAFPCSRVPVVEREVATDEKGHPSPVLPGHRHLWLLRHHLCDRVHEEGHPRRDLFPLPSILHGAAEVHRCRRSRSEVRQEVRAQSLAEKRKGRRKREEGKCCFPLFLFP